MSEDILIVSTFGRGHWLAAELAERGLSVHLMDLTKHMGRWIPEDIEGPFGLFTDPLTSLQKERLIQEDYLDLVENGLTIWLHNGPLDMKGYNFSYRFQKSGYPESLKEYLSESHKQGEYIKNMSFEKNWLAHLAHQLASNTFKNNTQGMDCGSPLPFMLNYFVRRVSRRGYQKNCDWLQSKGVHISYPSSIEKISTHRSKCKSLEDGEAEVTSDQFIWCLSSEESQVFTPKIYKKLFPHGYLSAQWYWLRYRIQLDPDEWLQALPIKFIILEDIHRPWTHTNLCMVQKTPKEYNYDVWLRLPYTYRRQKFSLEEISQDILKKFKQKIPFCQPQLLDMPQDYNYTEEELGPGLFPVYKDLLLKKNSRLSLKNFHFDGPEIWSSLDWLGRFKSQNNILSNIQQFYKKQYEKKSHHLYKFKKDHPSV